MQCIFCSQNIQDIDYKDVKRLRIFVSARAKIKDPKFTNTCAKHQRRVATAVKRARFMGLIPYVRQ